MPFKSQGGNVKDIFVTEEELIERFTGKQLWLWGAGSSGQLGNDSAANQSSPIQTISGGINWRSASVGGSHTAAIKTDGSLWLWGDGSVGRLGNNATTNQSSPVQTVSGGTNWRSVSAGGSHTGAIKTDGSLWLWGAGSSGRLGNNCNTDRSSPVQTISGGTNWRSVSAGGFHTAAIKTDGSLWLFGRNLEGQLGSNSTTNQSSPIQTISGGINWRSASVGGSHTAAIKTDGSLWLWGDGSVGRLGNNAITNRSSPVQTVSGGTNWRTVSAGGYHTAAIKTDGTLWLWGCGAVGQLGDATRTNRSSPVQTVSGGNNWRSATTGFASAIGVTNSAAIKTDGSLWLWGSAACGRLGNNSSSANQSSPVQTISGGTNWRSVSLGPAFASATRLEEF
jgi:alpha-tubulin suppressor-like RCC1 family protein